jgi:hypothetical protein
MKKIACLVPAICLAALSVSCIQARADALNLSSYVGDTISMTVNSYASGENNGSFYVGLTQLNLSSGKSSESIEGFCDDFQHEIRTPDTYNVIVTAVAGSTTLEEEAYYGMKFGSNPSGNTAMDTDVQELIWNLSGANYWLNPEMQTLQQQMLLNYQSANYSDSFYLNAGGKGQSFMVADPVSSPVPEPSTLATFGTGLFAAAGFARRRFLRS